MSYWRSLERREEASRVESREVRRCHVSALSVDLTYSRRVGGRHGLSRSSRGHQEKKESCVFIEEVLYAREYIPTCKRRERRDYKGARPEAEKRPRCQGTMTSVSALEQPLESPASLDSSLKDDYQGASDLLI